MSGSGVGFDDFGATYEDEGAHGAHDGRGGRGRDTGGPSFEDYRTLPPPPELHPSAESSEIDGRRARVVAGRAVQAPLLTQASNHPGATSLRVWKVVRGERIGIGTIEIGADEDDFARRFVDDMPGPTEDYGVFICRPLLSTGTEMGHEFQVKISGTHKAVQEARARRSNAAALNAPAPGGFSMGGGPDVSVILNPVLELMRAAQDRQERLAEGEARMLAVEREQLRRQQEEIAARQNAMAENVTIGVGTAYERMIAADQERTRAAMESAMAQHRQASDNQAGFLAAMMEANNARAAQDRAMLEAKAAADEARWRREREEERERRAEERRADAERIAAIAREAENQRIAREAELERRFEREKREAEERIAKAERDARLADAERQRKHEAEMDAIRRRDEADREHRDRMARLEEIRLEGVLKAQTSAGGSGLEGMLEKAAGILGLLGMDPKDAIQRVLGGGGEEGPSAAVEVVKSLIPTLGGVAQAYFATRNGGPMPVQQQAPRQIQQRPPAYIEAEDDEDDEDEDEDDYGGGYGGGYVEPAPRFQQAPQPQPQRPAQAPAQAPQAPAQAAGAAPTIRVTVPSAPTVQVAVPAAAPTVRVTVPGGQPLAQVPVVKVPVSEAIQDGEKMSPADKDAARKALRELVPQIRGVSDEDAAALIVSAVFAEPRIGYYIQEVSLRIAVLEASGDDTALLTRLAAGLKRNPLAPDDLNYGL